MRNKRKASNSAATNVSRKYAVCCLLCGSFGRPLTAHLFSIYFIFLFFAFICRRNFCWALINLLQVVVAIVNDISPFVRHGVVVICWIEFSAVKFSGIAVYGLDFINSMSRFMFAKLTFATFPVLTQHISLLRNLAATPPPYCAGMFICMRVCGAFLLGTTFSSFFFVCSTFLCAPLLYLCNRWSR